jgi:hypothetical protein
MELSKEKILRITLIIVAIDYIIVGVFTFLLPEIFGITPVAYSQISITVGLFVLVVSTNIKKYQNFLWVIVIQEIGVIIVHVYQIFNEISDFYNNITILAIHFIYLVVIILLAGNSIIPKAMKTTESS